MRAFALLIVAVGACSGATPAPIANRPSVTSSPGGCEGGGDTLRADLDGDEAPDEILLIPSAEAVTCLEIRATRAARFVCSGAEDIEQVEVLDDELASAGTAPCDPMGVPITIVPAFPVTNLASRVMVQFAPAGAGLWLAGGDAFAAIVWRPEGWRWIVVGA